MFAHVHVWLASLVCPPNTLAIHNAHGNAIHKHMNKTPSERETNKKPQIPLLTQNAAVIPSTVRSFNMYSHHRPPKFRPPRFRVPPLEYQHVRVCMFFVPPTSRR